MGDSLLAIWKTKVYLGENIKNIAKKPFAKELIEGSWSYLLRQWKTGHLRVLEDLWAYLSHHGPRNLGGQNGLGKWLGVSSMGFLLRPALDLRSPHSGTVIFSCPSVVQLDSASGLQEVLRVQAISLGGISAVLPLQSVDVRSVGAWLSLPRVCTTSGPNRDLYGIILYKLPLLIPQMIPPRQFLIAMGMRPLQRVPFRIIPSGAMRTGLLLKPQNFRELQAWDSSQWKLLPELSSPMT